MANKTKFFKVSSLPGTLEADAFYFVANGSIAESYITDSSGVAKSMGNSSMINSLIDDKISSLQAMEIVSDITSRDALAMSANGLVLVTDASADSTVDSGAALYAYNSTDDTFTKVSEYESMDVTLQWANIQGAPTSDVADIDDAVSKRHEHSNLTELELIGEDSDGDITYNGQPVVGFTTVAW